MILAAGLGTRLRPLTLVRPKALVPVMGTPVLDYWVTQLYEAGFEAVVVNAFHLQDELLAAVKERTWPIPVWVEAEPVLLGTGGGVRNVLDFFENKPFAVINGDTICKIPLKELYERHLDSGAGASLLMHDFPAFNNVAVKGKKNILGFGKEAIEMDSRGADVELKAFTGIHFIDPEILKGLSLGVPEDILTVYRKLIADGNPPLALFHPGIFWREMGSLEAYRSLNEELSRLSENFLPPLVTGRGVCLHPRASISSSASLKGFVVAGEGCRVHANVVLENVILWDHVEIETGSVLRNCIVTDGMRVNGVHDNETLFQVKK